LSHKDEATREALASELGDLKNKYSQLEQAYNDLKHRPSQSQPRGLVPAQGHQPQIQFEDTFYQEANLEVSSELGLS
jgi:hypothetical protein